jgi:hypothetical protein
MVENIRTNFAIKKQCVRTVGHQLPLTATTYPFCSTLNDGIRGWGALSYGRVFFRISSIKIPTEMPNLWGIYDHSANFFATQ